MPAVPPPYPTHALSEAQLRAGWPDGVLTLRHTLASSYAWDAGLAIGGYLDAMVAGKILGRSCRSCERVLVPPRMFCEQCFRPTDAWVGLPSAGTVAAFSVCRVAWDLAPLVEPEMPAVIELGRAIDARLLHRLGGVDPADVSVGMAVQAVWKPASERVGSVLDIAHWCPVPHA
jgi:uncharacterized OB-fold protein